MSDLFGQGPDDGRPTDRLFLAVLPDAATAERMERLAHTLRKRLGLTGTPQSAERLHITLNHLGDFRAIPQNIVDAASRAVSSLVATPPFEVTLDRVVSFRAGEHKPLVLVGGEGVAALEGFHRQLQKALVKHGIKPEARFKPHVTLLRDRSGVAEQAVESFTWTVGEVVLVHSLLGRTRHLPLARWSLGAPIAPPRTETADFTDSDRHWMRRALELAAKAGDADDEVPVGAVIVDADGKLVSEASNLTGERHDPSAHAEMLAIAAAGKALGSKRLSGCTLYVSLEPCPMCAAALVHARIDTLVYAAASPKTGAAGSVFDLVRDHRHNHDVRIRSGLMADEAGRLLSDWFRRKRDALR
jgi:tRNA(adenine34) deaminase